ncbi:ATP-binding cassette domain-containing protein [Phenylobacterium sp. SCN 70-31]|uniref:ATP-binding cassette domain-containing protein n=1 Tax=Phenylobacterium sp. SCN 70-31 TaxID=1660129 RepID=UPI00086CB45A|nr:ATP-binding cassette domain-containing protein [Phenylobacterium sp. SCN 70-31]ODT88698.1 MAG: ABC transporter ATP-binding protein [Phenylobacterium sp. SCN 70-31]
MAETLIELAGVTRRYGARPALDDVDLSVRRGEFVALVGGSGSGKTTLLKTINGLIRPDAGIVRVAGRPVAEVDGPDLRRGIGYVFQDVGLFPHLTVAGNIAVTPRLLGWDAGRIAARVSELLELVALPAEMAGRAPAELSGGQRQRVGVARALAAEPALMLMDEPFGALDPLTRDALGDDYRALHDRLGLTTVMVTHDMGEAVLLADRLVVLASGRVVASGAPAALLAEAPTEEVRELLDAPRRQAERLRGRFGV